MNKQIEAEFETIAENVVSECERVRCDFGDFIEGLKDVEVSLRDRRVAGGRTAG